MGGYFYLIPCSDCQGEGSLDEQECLSCGGTGEEQNPTEEQLQDMYEYVQELKMEEMKLKRHE